MTPELTTRRWIGGQMPSGLGPATRHLKNTQRWILPNRGWVTFLLTFLTIISVVWSVESANWVATPPLGAVVLWGLLTGLILAKVRLHVLPLQIPALLMGIATVVWYGTQLIEGGSFSHSFGEMWDRLDLWFTAASTNGISTDPMPFGLVLVILSWLLGYLSGWFIFRHKNVWIPLLLSGFGILMNLSYISGGTFGFFFFYLLLALLLTAWMTSQRHQQYWSTARIALSPYLGAINLHAAFWFSLIVIILSFLLPLRHENVPVLRTGYKYLSLPAEHFKGDFNRLFAGLPARKSLAYRTFDDTLPFQGRIRLTDEKVFSVRTPMPSYLRVRSYPVYTSKGWTSGETNVVPLDWEPASSVPAVYRARKEITQRVTLNFGTRILMVAGSPDDADLRLKVEVPAAPTYTISLEESPSSELLPEDVRELARVLASQDKLQRNERTVTEIFRTPPRDLRLVDVATNDEDTVTAVTVERPLPLPLDTLSTHSERRLSRDDSYTVSSSVSLASPKELREAGEDYPAWVRDIYLGLPDSLPTRVRTLAQDLTGQAGTPYDKAVAIKNYLHTLTYTLDMPPLPVNGDGVDQLLFTVGGGYSEYFGSAMAVMLRAVGVPSRMVVGYTTGEPQEDGSFVVRDRNSHGWTAVFFPGYGWVGFEPTPGGEPIPRGEEATSDLEAGDGLGRAFDEEEEDFPFGIFGPSSGTSRNGSGLATLLAIGLYVAVGLLVVGTTAYLALRWLLGLPATPAGAYAKMARLSRLAGLGLRQGQSPYEYGRILGLRLSGYDTEIAVIADGYGKIRYGRKSLSKAEQEKAFDAWRTIRLPLFGHILRRRRKR